MTTYTISIDLICNIEGNDIISILFQLINKECEHVVAIDSNMKLLTAYVDKAKRPSEIASWISFLSDSVNFTKVNYEFDKENVEDVDILMMTTKVVGARKMIVHSLQSIDYASVNLNNEADVDGVKVPFITKDIAIQELNHPKLQMNVSNSMIAMNDAVITESNINQS